MRARTSPRRHARYPLVVHPSSSVTGETPPSLNSHCPYTVAEPPTLRFRCTCAPRPRTEHREYHSTSRGGRGAADGGEWATKEAERYRGPYLPLSSFPSAPCPPPSALDPLEFLSSRTRPCLRPTFAYAQLLHLMHARPTSSPPLCSLLPRPASSPTPHTRSTPHPHILTSPRPLADVTSRPSRTLDSAHARTLVRRPSRARLNLIGSWLRKWKRNGGGGGGKETGWEEGWARTTTGARSMSMPSGTKVHASRSHPSRPPVPQRPVPQPCACTSLPHVPSPDMQPQKPSFFPLPPTPLTPDRSRTPPCASPPAFRHNLHPQPFHPSYLPPARPMTGCNPLASSMCALAISPAPSSLT